MSNRARLGLETMIHSMRRELFLLQSRMMEELHSQGSMSISELNWSQWLTTSSFAADKVFRFIAGSTASPFGHFVFSPLCFFDISFLESNCRILKIKFFYQLLIPLWKVMSCK